MPGALVQLQTLGPCSNRCQQLALLPVPAAQQDLRVTGAGKDASIGGHKLQGNNSVRGTALLRHDPLRSPQKDYVGLLAWKRIPQSWEGHGDGAKSESIRSDGVDDVHKQTGVAALTGPLDSTDYLKYISYQTTQMLWCLIADFWIPSFC